MKLTVVLLLTLAAAGCGYGSNYNSGMMGGAAPSISQLVPNTATAPGTAFVLTVNGTGFGTDSVVYWNGAVRTTMYATGKQVTAAISAADVANPGTAQVYVHTNGRNSNTMNFTVN
ncbi:MAG: IPT/TIG domain-containing protein [bacterium]